MQRQSLTTSLVQTNVQPVPDRKMTNLPNSFLSHLLLSMPLYSMEYLFGYLPGGIPSQPLAHPQSIQCCSRVRSTERLNAVKHSSAKAKTYCVISIVLGT